MIIYILLFLIPVFIFYRQLDEKYYTSSHNWRNISILLILIIGLRHQVGGDWLPYLAGLERVTNGAFEESIMEKYEIGFNIIAWISETIGASIYGVNLFCATIFVIGLTSLCRDQPYPWLSLIIAIPYLVIVVGMGYTRQAVAIGFLMYGFKFLIQGNNLFFVFLVLLASSFHKPALIFIAFTLLKPGGGKFKLLFGIFLLIGFVGVALIIETAETYYLHYVEENMESAGAQIRIYLNVLPAFILFLYWKKWNIYFKDRWIWAVMALLSLVSAFFVEIASTAVDRIALYFIPLQLVVWSRFPILANLRKMRNFILFLIIFLYSSVLFVWMFFGVFSNKWIPYDNLLFPDF